MEENQAEYVRRLAEDWAEDCVKIGYVTTIKSESYKKFVSHLNALVTNPEDIRIGMLAADALGAG